MDEATSSNRKNESIALSRPRTEETKLEVFDPCDALSPSNTTSERRRASA